MNISISDNISIKCIENKIIQGLNNGNNFTGILLLLNGRGKKYIAKGFSYKFNRNSVIIKTLDGDTVVFDIRQTGLDKSAIKDLIDGCCGCSDAPSGGGGGGGVAVETIVLKIKGTKAGVYVPAAQVLSSTIESVAVGAIAVEALADYDITFSSFPESVYNDYYITATCGISTDELLGSNMPISFFYTNYNQLSIYFKSPDNGGILEYLFESLERYIILELRLFPK